MGISTHCNQILLGSFSQITHDNLYGIKINWFETRRCKSSKLLQFLHTTRMHSSRMRSVRSNGHFSGVSVPGGVCSREVSAPGGSGIPPCTEADTPSPHGQTNACKNITFVTSLRTVKINPKKTTKKYGA